LLLWFISFTERTLQYCSIVHRMPGELGEEAWECCEAQRVAGARGIAWYNLSPAAMSHNSRCSRTCL